MDRNPFVDSIRESDAVRLLEVQGTKQRFLRLRIVTGTVLGCPNSCEEITSRRVA